jgi:P pilus assembly chaperone PapD
MKNSVRFPRTSVLAGWRGIALALLLLATPVTEILASVLVAPTIVFLSDTKRTGRMILQNPTQSPKEIEVMFSFGLPVSDSLGNVRVILQDSAVTDPHSAVEWIRAFPRKIVLPAGQSQTVRFVASPPSDIPDGEYWARVVVRSQESSVNIPVSSDEGQISTKLNMIMQTAISLKYRKGSLMSALEFQGGTATLVDSSVVVTLDVANTGNVSYLGVMNCRVLDAKNREMASTSLDFAVYYDMRRRFHLPLASGGPFTPPYRVEVNCSNSGRTDIPPEDVVTGDDVSFMLAVE